MDKNKKLYLYIFTAVLVIGYGFVLAFGLGKLNIWRVDKANEYLDKAKKEQNISTRLAFSQSAILLHSTEDAYLTAGAAALELDNGKLAEKYLVKVNSAEGLLELGKAELRLGKLSEAEKYLSSSFHLTKSEETGRLLSLAGGDGSYPDVSRETNLSNRMDLIYSAFITLGYPQAAIRTLEENSRSAALSRDALIALATREIASGNPQDAYDQLLRAKAIDPYYPQIYQQLVQACEKLDKNEEARVYSTFLSNLTL